MPDVIFGNPNTTETWDDLWAKTGYKFPEQKPVNERKRAVASFVPHGAVVLDVACGAGQITNVLDPSITYIGLDFSSYALKLSKHLSIRGDVYNLPVKSKSVQAVIAMEILEHLQHPTPFIRELVRVAQKIVIISVPDNRLTPEDTHFHLCTYDQFSLYDILHASVIVQDILVTKTELNLIARIVL